jgi:hypothetical protein
MLRVIAKARSRRDIDDATSRSAWRDGSTPSAAPPPRCPKTLLRFTAAKGAGDHCEMRNRTLLDQRVFDWLDDILSTPRP